MKLITIALVLTLLAACNRLDSGNVLEKRYEPATTFIMMMPITYGAKGETMLMPFIIHDNEDYVLTVKGEYEGEPRVETVYVTEACYKSTRLGDTWHKTADCHFEDFNNTKVAQ